MNFRASFCDPFKPDLVELGNIQRTVLNDTNYLAEKIGQ